MPESCSGYFLRAVQPIVMLKLTETRPAHQYFCWTALALPTFEQAGASDKTACGVAAALPSGPCSVRPAEVILF